MVSSTWPVWASAAQISPQTWFVMVLDHHRCFLEFDIAQIPTLVLSISRPRHLATQAPLPIEVWSGPKVSCGQRNAIQIKPNQSGFHGPEVYLSQPGTLLVEGIRMLGLLKRPSWSKTHKKPLECLINQAFANSLFSFSLHASKKMRLGQAVHCADLFILIGTKPAVAYFMDRWSRCRLLSPAPGT